MSPAARLILLHDAAAVPASWNERMQPGEYAVHFSASAGEIDAHTCAVLPSLEDAEAYAQQQVAEHPALQCRVFDHHGFIGAPAQEISGKDFRNRNEVSSRFRRWVGSILFVVGTVFFVTDWVADFHYDWPSVLGSRLMIPGFILLVTEALMMHHQRGSKGR